MLSTYSHIVHNIDQSLEHADIHTHCSTVESLPYIAVANHSISLIPHSVSERGSQEVLVYNRVGVRLCRDALGGGVGAVLADALYHLQ